MRSRKSLGLVAVMFVSTSACFWRSETAPPVSAPVPPQIRLTATPLYRLVIDRKNIDEPSRLVVVRARIEVSSEGVFRFDPLEARVRLPDGNPARVFDRARALALLERTILADWDLSYTSRRKHAPGGLSRQQRAQLVRELEENLLDATLWHRSRPLDGYLVVDTGTPLYSLDSVALEVVANRVAESWQAAAVVATTSAPLQVLPAAQKQ